MEAFGQVLSVKYLKKVSKFICNQYLSYFNIPSESDESVWLPLKSHNQNSKTMLICQSSNIIMAIYLFLSYKC